MCGIAGIIKKKKNGPDNAWRKRVLMLCAMTRGVDAYGMYYDGKVYKNDDCVMDAIANDDLPPESWDANEWLFHARAASRAYGISATGAENAHPFECGHIIGAHNGCFSGWNLAKVDARDEGILTHEECKNINVDSHAFFALLDKVGYDVFKRIDGYGACWWKDDREPNKIFLWCSRQDLAIGEDEHCYGFASEERHLLTAGFDKTWCVRKDGILISITHGEEPLVEKVGSYTAFKPSKPRVVTQAAQFEFAHGRDSRHYDGFGFGGNVIGYHGARREKSVMEVVLDGPLRFSVSDYFIANYLARRKVEDALYCKKCQKAVLAVSFGGWSVEGADEHNKRYKACPTCYHRLYHMSQERYDILTKRAAK